MSIDSLDVDLRDHELDQEIQLVADLMVLAAATPGPLDPAVVDAALGVRDRRARRRHLRAC